MIPFHQSEWAIAADVMGLIAIKKRLGLGGSYRAIIGIVLGAINSLYMAPMVIDNPERGGEITACG